MPHVFSLMPQSYLVHKKLQSSLYKYGCVGCGAWATDPAGGGCSYSDCTDFNNAHIRHGGKNRFAPGEVDYPFSAQWNGTLTTPPAPAWKTNPTAPHPGPAMTASGLPIRVPSEDLYVEDPPAKVVTPQHKAGLDPEEIDWSAHKEFMKGM